MGRGERDNISGGRVERGEGLTCWRSALALGTMISTVCPFSRAGRSRSERGRKPMTSARALVGKRTGRSGCCLISFWPRPAFFMKPDLRYIFYGIELIKLGA